MKILLLISICNPSMAWVAPLQSNLVKPLAFPNSEPDRSNASQTRQRRVYMSTTNNEVDETIGHLTVEELRDQLRERGLKVSGAKSDLIDRLTTDNHFKDSDNHSDSSDRNEETTKPHSHEFQQLPNIIMEEFVKYTTKDGDDSVQPQLLPIQQKSYQHIANGGDSVLFSPTGTGKTLAYILPLAARLLSWKRDGSLANNTRKRTSDYNRNNDSLKPVEAATPSMLIMEPSRELARQVGKVWTRFHPTATKSSKKHVVTVYGGVPMARHAALLNSKTDVVVGTPGRIKELIREKYLSTSNLKSIVLDEADSLLNFKDMPEVEWLLDGMQNDYQLVLASATINKHVDRFVEDIMEIEVGEEGYFVVESNEDGGETEVTSVEAKSTNIEPTKTSSYPDSKPEVRHWSMAASASSRVNLASDLILTMAPRRGIIFAPSKAEVEKVAQELSERLSANDVSIHILHGDMVQAARSRTVAAFRGDDSNSRQKESRMTRILCATDVASRGLDLPAVDLVLQVGVPRQSGKDGTFDCELYIHRTGRAGRFGSTRTADAILLYDSSAGEHITLNKLRDGMKQMKDVDIMTRAFPSPREVMDASYKRALMRCEEFENKDTTDLVQYFKDRLVNDYSFDFESEVDNSHVLDKLASSMAALSGLSEAVRPRSLLTADPRDRTVRIGRHTSEHMTPSEVINIVKPLGSGKLGRIAICGDGSAVFDLSAKKAEKLVRAVRESEEFENAGMFIELPESLPS